MGSVYFITSCLCSTEQVSFRFGIEKERVFILISFVCTFSRVHPGSWWHRLESQEDSQRMV